MGDMTAWIDIVEEQPRQGQRIITRIKLAGHLDAVTRVTSYDRFCWEHWGIVHWKPMPEGQHVNPDA